MSLQLEKDWSGSSTGYCTAPRKGRLSGRGFPEGMTEQNLDLSVEPFPPLIPVKRLWLDSSLRPYSVKTPVSEYSTIRGTTHTYLIRLTRELPSIIQSTAGFQYILIHVKSDERALQNLIIHFSASTRNSTEDETSRIRAH